jgi:hypothetical protein
MEIVKLPAGQHATAETDCIRVQETSHGAFELTGSLLLACGDNDEAESISLISSEPYATYAEAESAGMAWARDHCVQLLHVSRSEGAKPLPDIA